MNIILTIIKAAPATKMNIYNTLVVSGLESLKVLPISKIMPKNVKHTTFTATKASQVLLKHHLSSPLNELYRMRLCPIMGWYSNFRCALIDSSTS